MGSSVSEYRIASLVKSSAASLRGRALLEADIEQLLGVGQSIATVLRDEMRVRTVFDLATSRTFNTALDRIDPEGTLQQEFARYGYLPTDSESFDPREREKVATLGNQGLEQLRFRQPETAAKLKSLLSIESVRELALWRPFQVARAILKKSIGGDVNDLPRHMRPDPDMPGEFVPLTGTYPSQQAYFESLHIVDSDLTDEAILGAEKSAKGKSESGENPATDTDVKMMSLGCGGQLDLMQTALLTGGFSKPAVGVLITSEQSWYNRGATLGQLVHSLPLAPGESTRVAMTDWRQVNRGARSEDDQQAEDTTTDTKMHHALNEITDAVARERQQGYSRVSTSSDAEQSANSMGGFSLSPLIMLFGPNRSGSSSTNKSLSTSVSRTSGTRNLAGRVNQDITTSTHQSSSSVRARRTAVVKETSEAESEQLTTRVVTNYNHMHAMSVQYYEVVQNYSVVTKATGYERCVFVPFKPFDFSDIRVILKFRAVLEKVALTEKVKEQLHAANAKTWQTAPISALRITQCFTNVPLYTLTLQAARLKKFSFSGGTDMYEVRLEASDSKGFSDKQRRRSGERELDIPVGDLQRLHFNPTTWNANRHTLTFDFEGEGKETVRWEYVVEQPLWDKQGHSSNAWYVLDFKKSFQEGDEAKAIRHLNENALYYSQAIWATLDETAWMRALSSLKYRGEPVDGRIVPIPLMMTGNYLAFRWYFKDQADKLGWLLRYKLLHRDMRAWMKRKGHSEMSDAVKRAYLDEHSQVEGDEGRKEVSVPIPTGGVHAEAVLGRYNSAEKLDLTRFWNWKESPIPIVPTEINPLKANARGASQIFSDLKASGLDPQAVHLHTEAPTAGKAAAQGGGTEAALQALISAGMFRDMSNAAGTAALTGKTLQSAQQGATEAGKQAGERLAIWSNMVSSMLAAGGQAVASRNLSNAGAAMNSAQQLDQGASQDPSAGAGDEDTTDTASTDTDDNDTTTNKEEVMRRIIGHWRTSSAKGGTESNGAASKQDSPSKEDTDDKSSE